MNQVKTFKTPDDLYAYYGCDKDTLSRTVYKVTDCGAWARIWYREVESKGSTIHSRDYRIKPTLLLGSIVEGADADTQTHELEFPFTSRNLNDVLDAIEVEADAIWHEWNDCADCGDVGGIS